MKPVKNKATNIIFAKDQEEYNQLPAHRTPTGTVVIEYDLTDEEIDAMLMSKKIYLSLMTFNHPLQPVLITTENPLENPESYASLQGYTHDPIACAYGLESIKFEAIKEFVDIDGWISGDIINEMFDFGIVIKDNFDEKPHINETFLYRPKSLNE